MKSVRFQLSDWLMLLAGLIWGLNFTLIKFSLKEIPPLPFNGLRLPLASLILLIWLLMVEGNLKIKKEHLFKIILLSVLGYTIYQYVFIYGINYTTASNTGVIFASAPIMITLLSAAASLKMPGSPTYPG